VIGEVHQRARVRLDLLEHFLYIGENNFEAAERFLDAAEAAFTMLAQMPGMGAIREFDHPGLVGLRSWPIAGFESFLIFYLPHKNGIDVLRVVSGFRDLDTIFGAAKD